MVCMLRIHLIMEENSQICRISKQLVFNHAKGEMPTREPRWRWAVPLRLRPLRMTDLSAGECLVRLTDRADTPYSRLLRSLTSSSSSLQGIVRAGLPSALASFVSSRSALRFAASRSALQPAGCAGWIELLRYSLMPPGDLALRRSPCSHRSSMAMPYLIIHILLQLLFKVNLNILWGYFEDF